MYTNNKMLNLKVENKKRNKIKGYSISVKIKFE